jgi:hypothetical protein
VRFPLGGATACVFPSGEPCTTTAADGSFTLPAYPAAVEAGLLLTAPGHLGLLLPIPAFPSDAGAEFIDLILKIGTFATLLSDADAAFIIEGEGGRYPDPGAGFIEFDVLDIAAGTPLEGASVTPSVAGGVGPVYLDDFGFPDPALTATSSLGVGSILNVPPGDVELTVTRPGYACSIPGGIAVGWVGSVDGFVSSTLAPVVAGANTRVSITCCPDDRLVGDGRFCRTGS